MNINDMKSSLKMDNLYFKECSIRRTSAISDGEFEADLEKKIEKIGEQTYDVELKLTIGKADVNIVVVADAQFLYEAGSDEKEASIINNNTVAIMFPFLRSQVSLLTTQPGMYPIVLPPINTAKFK